MPRRRAPPSRPGPAGTARWPPGADRRWRRDKWFPSFVPLGSLTFALIVCSALAAEIAQVVVQAVETNACLCIDCIGARRHEGPKARRDGTLGAPGLLAPWR